MVCEGSANYNKLIPPQAFLKLHYNPLIVQKTVNHRKNNSEFIGKQNFINEIYEKIKNFFFSSNTEKLPFSALITGESGSGKTHLVRCLCEKLLKDQDLSRQSNMNMSSLNVSQSIIKQSKLPLFASNINCESRMKFLGAWRPILRNMLEYKRRYSDESKA